MEDEMETIAPLLECPDDMVVQQTSPDGTVVKYATPQVTNKCNGEPVVVCDPPSGTLFAPGTTTVTCTATDAAGKTGTCTFDVKVVWDLLKELDPGDRTGARILMEDNEKPKHSPVRATIHLEALEREKEGIKKERQLNKEKELARERRTGSPGQPQATPPDHKHPEGVPIDHPASKLSRLALNTFRWQIEKIHRKYPDIFQFREEVEADFYLDLGERLMREEEACKNTLEFLAMASRSLNAAYKNRIRKKKGRRSARRRKQIGKGLKPLGLEHGSGNIKSLDNSSAEYGENLAAGDHDPVNSARAQETIEKHIECIDKMDPELRQIYDLFTCGGKIIDAAKIDGGLDKKDSSAPDCRLAEEQPSLSTIAGLLNISKTTAYDRLKKAFEQLEELMWPPEKNKPGV